MKYLITFLSTILIVCHLNAQELPKAKIVHKDKPAEISYPTGKIDHTKFSVTIIGSGNPQYNSHRSSPSALVQYNGTKFLVDMGNGTREQLEKLGYTRRNSPDALFLTHHHMDHNEEFIPMVHQKLMMPGEFLVAGPAPIKKMTDYVTEFYREDLQYRMKNKGQTFNEDKTNAIIKELQGDNSFSYKDVNISTTEVPHSIYTLSYRFDANGKSIVISGDLTYTPHLAKLAKGADILVLDCQVIRKGAKSKRPTNASRNKKGNSAHASIEEGARMAAEAGVKTLVITHLSNVNIDEVATKAKIAEQFKGTVILAQDFLTITCDGKVFMLQ
ncbi:MBL fold metallo-hydrolase [Saccharicrinis fermentans]|nr:MBL fold metallo-hydrolase [Saccharicrinis fermentans]